MTDFFNKRRLGLAIASPSRPELQQNNFALDRTVGKGLSAGGFGIETRGRLLGFGAGD
jgi:hypothetical protein